MSTDPTLDTKQTPLETDSIDSEKNLTRVVTREAELESTDGVNRGRFKKLWTFAHWLDSYGVELRGVERVPEDARHQTNLWSSAFFWCGANCQISTFALGALAMPVFQLGLLDASLTILFFNLLTTLPVALFSTFGQRTGLRQMVYSRYSFGSYGVYFPLLLNLLACIGWSTINTIVGASALSAVSQTNKLPIAAGVVIISLVTMCISLWGYRYIHMFEKWTSLPTAIIFVIMLGLSASSFSSETPFTGPIEAASVLSFGAALAGFALGWSSLAADYTVNHPHDASSTKIFIATYLGLNIPMISIEILGVAVTSTFVNQPGWEDAYLADGIGGLIYAPLSRAGGFGAFCTVLLALSVIANNVPNVYSFALSFQAFGKFAQEIPRFFLVIVGTAIYIVLSIVGASNFESALNNLLVILSYWLAIYVVILMEEHFIFRKGNWANYDLDAWNDRSKMPLGLAAGGAVCFGILGAVLGMAQILYVGVIGGKIGLPEFGGDIGFELSGAFAGLTYPLFRWLEIKYIGR